MQWPIEEAEKLRDKHISIVGENLVGGSVLEISGITASQVSKLVLCFLTFFFFFKPCSTSMMVF